MTRDHYEPNRFLGIPVGSPANARHGEEPQRMMGIPVDWLGPGPAGGGCGGAPWVPARRTRASPGDTAEPAPRIRAGEFRYLVLVRVPLSRVRLRVSATSAAPLRHQEIAGEREMESRSSDAMGDT